MQKLTLRSSSFQNSIKRRDHSQLHCLSYFHLIALSIIMLNITGCMTWSSSDQRTEDPHIVANASEIDYLKKVSDENKIEEKMEIIHRDSFSGMSDQNYKIHSLTRQLHGTLRQRREILSNNILLAEIIGSLVIEFDRLEKVYEQVSGVRGSLIEDFQQAKLEYEEIAETNNIIRQRLIQIQNETLKLENQTEAITAEARILFELIAVTSAQIRESKGLMGFLLGGRNRLENELSLLITQRNRFRNKSVLLEARLNELRNRLSELSNAQRKLVSKLNRHVTRYLDEFEQALTGTGLDVPALLTEWDIPSNGHSRGSGGPFVAYSPDKESTEPGAGDKIDFMLADLEGHVGKWEVLHQLLRQMPLSFPLKKYKITSKFGIRRDPFNGRPAMHYGLDMNCDSKPPVLATAPGIVTLAGWRRYYGGMVEINHGFGIYTRYGHLRKVLTRKGQKVDFHQMIGRMGSSGRSTGPHVHYEIIVNGIPQDPLKFINTGRYCFKRISKSIKNTIASPAS